MWRWRRIRIVLLVVFFCCAAGCARRSARTPLLVVGIDGAEWSVVRELWSQGRLPRLRALADAGSSAVLRTAYGPSPVIWTTIATGLGPKEHGITDFVVATPRGDVPVTSTLRRAPALWNMLTQAERRVAVLGWWATWPAEEVNGVVLSDRLGIAADEAIFPADFGARLAELRSVADERRELLDLERPGEVGRRDRVMAIAARALVEERNGYDLVLLYFRGVDVVSHGAWKYWRPERFPEIDAAELEAHREDVPRAYAAVDEAIGAVLDAAGGIARLNVVVLSDHGFRPHVPEEIGFFLDFDRVLERLGFLRREAGGVDVAASRALSVSSPHHERVKKLRLRRRAGAVDAAVRSELERQLGRVRLADGRPPFRLRDPRPAEAAEGADLVVVVEHAVAGDLTLDGVPWPESGWSVWRISGTHHPRTHGLLIAAGPDVARGAELDRISIHDMAATFLYALGLPYGRDFAGRPKAELFTAEFRARMPLRAIDSWGRRHAAGPAATAADAALLEELRALGYLD